MSLSETIYFNDVALADKIPGAHVIDIQVGSVETDHSSISRAVAPGSIFASKRDGIRAITLLVELPFDKESSLESYSLLRAWAESDQPARMQLPNRTNGYINCLLKSMSELSVKTWYQPVTLDFVSYDPYFYGVARSASAGDPFTVAGDAGVPFDITAQLATPIDSPEWTIDGKHVIALSGQIGVGKLVIETGRGLVTLGGQPTNGKIALNTRFVRLSPGRHVIESSVESTISWKDGWR